MCDLGLPCGNTNCSWSQMRAPKWINVLMPVRIRVDDNNQVCSVEMPDHNLAQKYFERGERTACQLIWVDAIDCDPPHSLDMASEHDASKVAMLVEAFEKNGFDKSYPALIGYPLGGRIQLLSGTHRRMAAEIAGVKLPVSLWLRSDIEERWGTELWNNTIADIPVKDLENYPVKDGFIVSPYDRVDLTNKENSNES